MFSCVGLLIIPFIKLYTTGVNDIDYIVLSFAVLATVTEAIYCIREPYVILVQAAGKYEETKKGAAAEAAINLFVSLILIVPLGINGVIIGTLVANVFRTVQYAIFASKYILNVSLQDRIRKAVWLIFTVAVILVVNMAIIGRLTFAASWIGWIYKSMLVFVISLVIVLISSFVFYRDCMNQLIRLFLRKKSKSSEKGLLS